MSSAPPHAVSLSGRRVLVLGAALLPLSQDPLTGAHVELGGLEKLIGVGPADADLIIIDADAWDGPGMAAGIQALTLAPAPPPVLLVGANLPTSVVRNLLRLERSDVLDAPYSSDNIAAAINGLMVEKAA